MNDISQIKPNSSDRTEPTEAYIDAPIIPDIPLSDYRVDSYVLEEMRLRDIELRASDVKLPWYEAQCIPPTKIGLLEELFPNGMDDYEKILSIGELELIKDGPDVGGFMQPIKVGIAPVYMKDGSVYEVHFPIYRESRHEIRDDEIYQAYGRFRIDASKTQFYQRQAFHTDVLRAKADEVESDTYLAILAVMGLSGIVSGTSWYQNKFNRPVAPKGGFPANAGARSAYINQATNHILWKEPKISMRLSRLGGYAAIILVTISLVADLFKENPEEKLIREIGEVLNPNLPFEEYSAILDEKPYLEDIVRVINFEYGRYRDYLLEEKRAAILAQKEG